MAILARSFCRHCSKPIHTEGVKNSYYHGWYHDATGKHACTEAEPLPCGSCGKCLDCIRLERSDSK